jgi:hypothetical protein
MLLVTESVVEKKDQEGVAKAENFQREAILAMIQSGVIKMREIDFNNEDLADEDGSDLLLKNLQQLNRVVEGLQSALDKQCRKA